MTVEKKLRFLTKAESDLIDFLRKNELTGLDWGHIWTDEGKRFYVTAEFDRPTLPKKLFSLFRKINKENSL